MLEPVRRTSAALATLSLAVLALTGCSSTPSFDGAACDRATSASATLTDSVSTSGEVGAEPKVEVYAPVSAKSSTFADAVVGDGTAIVSANQPFIANVTTFDGETGEKLQTTGYDASTTQPHDIAYWSQVSPALSKVLQCATGGSRVVGLLTPKDMGAQADAGSIVIVFDIGHVFLPKAEGAPQFNDARGLPTVVRAPDGTPGVIIPDSAAPKEAVVQTLIKGDGPKVKEDDFVVVNHTVLNWDDKSVAGTSWGSTSLVTTPLPEMVGATVGSQIMIVTPAADSSPAQVLVVDILGITTAAPQQQQ
jgi:peptidylprolyl isomerase